MGYQEIVTTKDQATQKIKAITHRSINKVME